MLSVLVLCFCVYVALRPPWCLPTSAQRQRPLTEGSTMTLSAGEAVIENGWMGVSLLLYYLYLFNSYAPPLPKADGDICTKLLPLAVQLKCQVEKFKWLLCCSAAGLHPGGGGDSFHAALERERVGEGGGGDVDGQHMEAAGHCDPHLTDPSAHCYKSLLNHRC